jgi:hypothetical protein
MTKRKRTRGQATNLRFGFDFDGVYIHIYISFWGGDLKIVIS